MVSRSKRRVCTVCGVLIPKDSSYFIIYERIRDSRVMKNNRSGICPACLVNVACDLVQGVDD